MRGHKGNRQDKSTGRGRHKKRYPLLRLRPVAEVHNGIRQWLPKDGLFSQAMGDGDKTNNQAGERNQHRHCQIPPDKPDQHIS